MEHWVGASGQDIAIVMIEQWDVCTEIGSARPCGAMRDTLLARVAFLGVLL